MSHGNVARHVRAGTAPAYWGPGDKYTFLATGAQTGGTYFLFLANVPPGGGPEPHFHTREDEWYYVLEGTLDVTMDGKVVNVSAGDFVHIPRNTPHGFLNKGATEARMLLTFVPAGIEGMFEEALQRVTDHATPPPNWKEEAGIGLRKAGPIRYSGLVKVSK